MAGTPDQTGLAIHSDPVRSSFGVAEGDGSQHVANGASFSVDLVIVNSWAVQGRELLADDPEPKRRIGRVAVGRVFAVDGVGQRAVFFEVTENDEQFAHFFRHSGGEQTAGAD